MLEQSLDQLPVTVELSEVPINEALTSVGRRCGVEVSRVGNLFFFGEVKREDRGVLVRRCRRLKADELLAAVTALHSDIGDSTSFQDGLLVCSDRVEVLVRISELIDNVEAAESPCWVIQLHLVSLSANELAELGVEGTPALEIAAAFGQASSPGLFGALASQSKLNAGLSAVLKVAKTSGRSAVVAEPMFYLVDGSKRDYQRGGRVPVPKRTVSNQGTVTTSGFEFVQTGLTVTAELREQTERLARLSVSIDQSDITGYVEGAPITSNEHFSGDAVLASGGVYLLGSVTRSETQEAGGVGLNLARKDTEDARVMQIWARIVRVVGPAVCVEQSAEFPERLPPPLE